MIVAHVLWLMLLHSEEAVKAAGFVSLITKTSAGKTLGTPPDGYPAAPAAGWETLPGDRWDADVSSDFIAFLLLFFTSFQFFLSLYFLSCLSFSQYFFNFTLLFFPPPFRSFPASFPFLLHSFPFVLLLMLHVFPFLHIRYICDIFVSPLFPCSSPVLCFSLSFLHLCCIRLAQSCSACRFYGIHLHCFINCLIVLSLLLVHT